VRTTAAPTRKRASSPRRRRTNAGAARSPRATGARARRPAAQIFDLRLASDDPLPVYQQLVDQLRLLVGTGELRPGSRLPSARHLAANLGVNRNTALRAYMVLAREGVFEGRRGGGTVVIGPARDAQSGVRIPPPLAQQINQLVAASSELGVKTGELLAYISRQSDVRTRRSELRVAFVECNPESLDHYVGRIREEFGVNVTPVLLSALAETARTGALRDLDCIVSTFFHLSEVRRLLRDTTAVELFAIGVRPHLSVLDALERLARKSSVGVMYYERPGDLLAAERLARMAEGVAHAGVRELRVRPVLVRSALSARDTAGLDALVVRPENVAPIRQKLPASLPVIEFVNDLDVASRHFLGEVFDDLAMRHARGIARPAAARSR
jgi:DNA-binding transcriptional regulator YhcF (GntR family)